VSVIYVAPADVYRKVATSDGGVRYVDAEHEGLSWYAGRLNESPAGFIRSYCRHDGYARLDLRTIVGLRMDYMAPLRENEPFLGRCIDHYLATWPREAIVPCHGDLTLDNVFFAERGPRFFDWEHFSAAGEEWGFDLAYLILFAGALPYFQRGRLPAGDAVILRRLWRRLVDSGLSPALAVQPLDHFQHVFQRSDHWRDIVARSPRKLFPMWLDRGFGEYLHAIVNGARP
jgi:hypothetical protein